MTAFRTLAISPAILLSASATAQQPAAPAQPPPASQPLSTSLGLVVFPAKGQAPQKQSQDEGGCYAWAKGQTGVDPLAPPPAAQPAAQQPQQQAAGQAAQQQATQQAQATQQQQRDLFDRGFSACLESSRRDTRSSEGCRSAACPERPERPAGSASTDSDRGPDE